MLNASIAICLCGLTGLLNSEYFRHHLLYNFVKPLDAKVFLYIDTEIMKDYNIGKEILPPFPVDVRVLENRWKTN